MPKTRIPSPARSQGDVRTPKRKKTRASRSLCSPALSTASGRLTSLIDQFKDKNRQSFALSPLNSRSVLNDNTDIEEPRRKSWWKKLDENSQAVMDVLDDNKLTDANNLIEDIIDIEVLSQEKKNFTLDLPESSDNESINSIVLPQRKLFTQKENQPQKKFGHLIGNRETLAKLHKTNTENIDKTVNTGARELFQNTKRTKPIFPAALLQISPNKTAVDKTKENLVVDPKPPVKNIFGNRPNNKRKNIFAEFIVSESEDEIPDIQPKVFGFQKKLEQRRISSASKGRDPSPTSSITTDIEMDDWRHLPSSTMVENQLEDMVAGNTPIKRARLSKLSEAKESEAGTVTIQTNTTGDKTKQSNKSTSSKNKSKSSPELKDKLFNNSRTTRSMVKNTSVKEELHITSKKQVAKSLKNESQNRNISEDVSNVSTSNPKDTEKQTTLNKSNNLNKTKIRNNTKATENEFESDDNGLKINNETKILSKSSAKNKSINTEKNVNENDIKMSAKIETGNNKIQDKSKDTSFENIEEDNQEDEDEHNFSLQYEDDIVKDEEVVQSDQHKTQKNYMKIQKAIVLEKNTQNEINNSMKNKSLTQQKQSKVIEESVEFQQNEINTADDNVDGIQENDHEAEIYINQEHAYEESVAKVDENELSKTREDPNETEANQVNESNNDDAILSQKNEDEHLESPKKVTNESDADKANITDADENKAIASGETVEDEANASNVEENKNETNESDANEDIGNKSHEDEGKANESEEDENKANESDEEEASVYEEANASQEVETEANESQEKEAEVNQSQEIEEEVNESHVEDHDNSDEENQDEEESANETQEHDVSANESQEGESEADVNESEEVEHGQQLDDSDEADKAIASDAETSDQDNDDEMEVDEEEEETHEDDEREQIEQNEIEPSDEVIEESPNATHDTTGRNRNKELVKSPEVIRNNRIAQMDSFTANGRNTSVRKTKSIKDLNIRPSLAPPRDSIGFSDGTTNSSAEGSGWDSHRTTRKTLRQTFGKEFTPRKSLRALVMEKSAKRHTEHIDMQSETVKFPQANSTEFPDSMRDVEDTAESDHELSRRTRQTTLETYLQKIKHQNIEKKLKMEEAVRNSLKGTVKDTLSLFKVPNKPAPRRPKPTQNKQKKQITSIIPFDELPSEVIKDMKYKPPKRFQPTNASWITKRLYKFLENKLEGKYDYKARVRAEKLVETIYHFAKDLRRHDVAPTDAVDVLKHELARLEVVRTHFEFYEFFHEFMPREVRVKVVPDIVNKIALPRHGVFSDILREVQGF